MCAPQALYVPSTRKVAPEGCKSENVAAAGVEAGGCERDDLNVAVQLGTKAKHACEIQPRRRTDTQFLDILKPIGFLQYKPPNLKKWLWGQGQSPV